MRFAGAPDSAVENAVIRTGYMHYRSLVKPRYLDEVRESPPYSGLAAYLAYVRGLNMGADKAIRQSTPQNMRFAGTPVFTPRKILRILRGDPGFLPHEKSLRILRGDPG